MLVPTYGWLVGGSLTEKPTLAEKVALCTLRVNKVASHTAYYCWPRSLPLRDSKQSPTWLRMPLNCA
jgi:hypothetical protein